MGVDLRNYRLPREIDFRFAPGLPPGSLVISSGTGWFRDGQVPRDIAVASMSATAASELEKLKTQTPEEANQQRAPLLPEGVLSVTSKAEIPIPALDPACPHPSSDAGTQDAVLSLLSLGQFAPTKRPREEGEAGPARQRPLRGIKPETDMQDMSPAGAGRGGAAVSSLRGIKPHSSLRGIKPEPDMSSSEEGQPSTLYPLPSTLYPLPCTLYTLPSTLYTLHSTLYTFHTLHSTH